MSRVFFEAYCKATFEVALEEDRFPSLSEIDSRMKSGAVYAFKDRLMKNTEFFEEVKISGVSYLVPRAKHFQDISGTYTDLFLNLEEGQVQLPSRRRVPLPSEEPVPTLSDDLFGQKADDLIQKPDDVSEPFVADKNVTTQSTNEPVDSSSSITSPVVTSPSDELSVKEPSFAERSPLSSSEGQQEPLKEADYNRSSTDLAVAMPSSEKGTAKWPTIRDAQKSADVEDTSTPVTGSEAFDESSDVFASDDRSEESEPISDRMDLSSRPSQWEPKLNEQLKPETQPAKGLSSGPGDTTLEGGESGSGSGSDDTALEGGESGSGSGSGDTALEGGKSGSRSGSGDTALEGGKSGSRSGSYDTALEGGKSGSRSGSYDTALEGGKSGSRSDSYDTALEGGKGKFGSVRGETSGPTGKPKVDSKGHLKSSSPQPPLKGGSTNPPAWWSNKRTLAAAIGALLVLIAAVAFVIPDLIYPSNVGEVQYSAYLKNSSLGPFLSLDLANPGGLDNQIEMQLASDIDKSISARGGVVTISHTNGTHIHLLSSSDASVRVYLNESVEEVPLTLVLTVPEGYDSSLSVHEAAYGVRRTKNTIHLNLNVTSNGVDFEQSYQQIRKR